MNYSLEGFEIYENSHELHSDIAICVIPVLLAIILTSVLSNLYIPHELVAMLVGGGLGIIITYMPLLHRMAERFWAPYDVLVVLQPILMLKMLYTVDTFIFMKSLSQILLVSTVGLFMFILIFGFFLMILTLHEASLINVIIAGSILAPIDIPDLILELERVKNLEVLMDGESTFGTALCLMTFDLCVGGYAGIITKWYQVVCFYLRYIIVSTVVGYILGKTTAVLFRLLYNDFMNAVVALVASSYMVYFLCEHIFYCSGTIGCFINIFCLSLERPSLSLDVDVEIQRFLNICYYNAELFSTVVLSACVMVRLLDFFKDFQFPLALGVYIIGSVIRFLTLLLLSPILSRIGYGLDFTGLLAIFWAAKKGPLQIITTIALTHHSIIDDVGSEILCFTLVYLVLLYLINGTTLKFILQKFGLILFSEARKNNINNCFKFINERRLRLISALKMNRFYSDSNWPLIHEATKLFNPFKVETVHGLVEDTDLWGFRTTYCPTCVKNVPVDPTKKDYLEMMNEVRRRVLKTERVSYVKQYEVGILDQHELRALLEYVEKAVDSKELIIHLDDIMRLFKDTVGRYTLEIVSVNDIFKLQQVILKLKKYLMSFKFRDLGTAPQNRIKRTFYTIAISRNYEFTLYAIILLNIVSAVVEMLLLYYHIPDFDIMVIVNTIFFTIYLVDFFIKIVGYSNYSLSQGVKLFFRLIWNRLDFMMLILATIDIIITNLIYLSNAIRYNYVLESFAILRIFRILRLSKLVSEKFYLKMLSHCDNLIDNRLTYAFTIGKALVIGYEEATELIPKIVNNFKIQEGIRSQLENDKVTVSKELGIIAKERPWIATNVKTKQAILATLVFMRNNIYQLKTDGVVDVFEFGKLKKALDGRFRAASYYKTMTAVSPKAFFYEVPWLCGDEAIMDYLYINGTTKIWDANEVLCSPGDTAEGIYILVAGLIKMQYDPSDEMLTLLKNYGALPIKDFLNNKRFKEKHEEYVLMGNTIGEIAVLTGRPHSCTIVAAVPSQTYIIPTDAINAAMHLSADPIEGLAARLWKYISWNLCRSILSETPVYQNASQDQLNLILYRGVVPNLNCYEILVLSELVEFIIIIEGLVVDHNTREIYTAPCFLPRTVHKIIIPDCSNIKLNINIVTKLMMFPIKGIDASEMMMEEQRISDLVPHPKSDCIVKISPMVKIKKRVNIKSQMKRIQSKIPNTVSSRFYPGEAGDSNLKSISRMVETTAI